MAKSERKRPCAVGSDSQDESSLSQVRDFVSAIARWLRLAGRIR
jgi:hypothetical protein